MFKIEKFGNRKVSFERENLTLTIDAWGEDVLFNPEFAAELNILWRFSMVKPIGDPVWSRMNCNFAVGETIQRPNVITATFLCEQDLEEYAKQAREGLKKEEAYLSWKQIRKDAEKDEVEAKANRAKALEADKKRNI